MLEWQEQERIFEKAKKSISGELSKEMVSWSFAQMIEVLKTSIKTHKKPDDRDPTGTFCLKYLKGSKGNYKIVRNEVQGFFRGREVLKEDTIMTILRTLKKFQDGILSKDPVVADHRTEEVVVTPQSGIVRKLVLLVITMLNSYVMVITEAEVKPSDVFDADRMQIRNALQKICKAFGIEVTFPESQDKNEPVTLEDLREIGFSKRRGL